VCEQEKFNKLIAKYPHSHEHCTSRPHLSRRRFFEIAGAGVAASYLAQKPAKAQDVIQAQVQMQNSAKNVIYILLAGAPSHTDLFDYKPIAQQPASFEPTTINGAMFPAGLMPKLAAHLQNNNFSIIRSMQSWGLVHTLGQTWTQIGRNPAAVLGNISPNIGSVVAIEKGDPASLFPPFIALNSGNCAGPGYFSAQYAPFKVTPATSGLRNTTNQDGQARFTSRWNLLHSLDDNLRYNSPLGQPMDDYNVFYESAYGMMYNPIVNKAFTFTTAEHQAYGSTSFGDSCLVARKILEQNQGTRYIEITLGGWDMHVNIYQQANLPSLAPQLDKGLAQLITDLQADGLYDSTMIVMAGEFGRTVGPLTAAAGRDHWLQQFAVFAGGGVKGGTIIGSTDAQGSATVDYGWSRQRNVHPEDIEATIYSALGINWTTIRMDDPLHRGFYYVPSSDQDLFGPVNELWGG
jgi:hypothetical protein